MIQLVIFVWILASWFTHIITCFNEEAWGFLVAGAIAFPIAVAHGTWLWF
jgi:hypothetical protein